MHPLRRSNAVPPRFWTATRSTAAPLASDYTASMHRNLKAIAAQAGTARQATLTRVRSTFAQLLAAKPYNAARSTPTYMDEWSRDALPVKPTCPVPSLKVDTLYAAMGTSFASEESGSVIVLWPYQVADAPLVPRARTAA